MYTNERHQRNSVDLAKATYIRPGSNKADAADTPAHSFDIVTTEREWTLCAESQENVQKWLKLLTRAVDEDVAILPDEDLLFKVKPKVDPMGVLNSTDYSTTLRVSANGVSVCIPDTSGNQNSSLSSITGGSGAEKEQYFWVYTDFYKWSLLSQSGKLALLVNVFADASFSRRNEYIFRNKEAVRLATAIEFFIEKFMSVMHIRLESTAGAFDDVEESTSSKPNKSGGLHQADDLDNNAYEEPSYAQPEELDLLGLDIEDEPPVNNRNSYESNPYPSYSQPVTQVQKPRFSDDPFGDDPFGEAPPQRVEAYNNDPFSDTMFQAEALHAPLPTAVPYPNSVPYAAASDPFGDDPFGSNEPAIPLPASPKATVQSTSGQLFNDDPFGSSEQSPPPAVRTSPKATPQSYTSPFDDPFGAGSGSSAMLSSAPSAPLIAPPLTPAQLEQHSLWLQGALVNGGGPLFDDGSLQIASKVEVRGSQGRITLYYRSQGSDLSEFEASIKDPAGLIRCQLSPLTSNSLAAGGQTEQTLLAECMQPASPGPLLSLTYNSVRGKRTVSIALPLVVTTFNEPLVLSGTDFSNLWEQLVAPGQEVQEVLSLPRPIIPRDVLNVLSSVRTAQCGAVKCRLLPLLLSSPPHAVPHTSLSSPSTLGP